MKLNTNTYHLSVPCWEGFQGHGIRDQGHTVTAMKILWSWQLLNCWI